MQKNKEKNAKITETVCDCSTRNVVETVIDLSKDGKTKTWSNIITSNKFYNCR